MIKDTTQKETFFITNNGVGFLKDFAVHDFNDNGSQCLDTPTSSVEEIWYRILEWVSMDTYDRASFATASWDGFPVDIFIDQMLSGGYLRKMPGIHKFSITGKGMEFMLKIKQIAATYRVAEAMESVSDGCSCSRKEEREV